MTDNELNFTQSDLPDIMRLYESLSEIPSDTVENAGAMNQEHNLCATLEEKSTYQHAAQPQNYRQYNVRGQYEERIQHTTRDVFEHEQPEIQHEQENQYINAHQSRSSVQHESEFITQSYQSLKYDHTYYHQQQEEQYHHPHQQRHQHIRHDGTSVIYENFHHDNTQSDSRKRFVSSETLIDMPPKPPTKSRKKGVGDVRWSKRFTWPDDLHANFVSAIFEVGLKHASPSYILEQSSANQNGDEMTIEEIRSYLLKYRHHRPKSQHEFLEAFSKRKDNTPSVDSAKPHIPLAGAIAGYLSYKIMSTEKMARDPNSSNPANIDSISKGSSSALNIEVPVNLTNLPLQNKTGHVPFDQEFELVLPQLTGDEKRSPIGAAMGYFLGLFMSLKQQILKEKKLNTEKDSNASSHSSDQTSAKAPDRIT